MSATRLGPVLRRLMPRFSLRTLMVFMGLVSAGYALWGSWRPWHKSIRLDIPPPPILTGDPVEGPSTSLHPKCGSSVVDVQFGHDYKTLIAYVADWESVFYVGSYRACTWITDSTRLIGNKHVPVPEGFLLQANHIRQWRSSPDRKYRIRSFYSNWSPLLIGVEYQRQRHPDVWYGILWLPQLYAVALFALLLAWSAWKDIRAFGRQTAPLCLSTQE